MTLGEAPSARPFTARARRWLRSEAWRFAAAFLIVGASGLLAEVLSTQFGVTRLSMLFLGAVVLVALWHGAQPALFAAVLAFLVYNFFLTEPRFTFQFAGVEDILTLIIFLTVALATGILAGRVRDEGIRSRARAASTAALFQASRDMSAMADEDELRASLAERVAATSGGEACVAYAGRRWLAPAGAAPPGPERIAAGETGPADDAWRACVLTVDDADLGLVLWRPRLHARGEADDALVRVVADLGAAAIARARLGQQKSEIEALARTEKLRAALLSSISHDFRTPLSSILASVSSLREFGDRFPKETRDDLLSTIEEETERLNRFVVNLLNMTKLEAGALTVQAGPMDLGEIVHAILSRRQGKGGARNLSSTLPDTPLLAAGDPVLFEQALSNVVDNALRYCPPSAEIAIGARPAAGEAIVLDIEDRGPGLTAEDAGRIFEKFYRAPATAAAQAGAGLGLSITRGLVESMGGQVEAGRRRDGAPGLRVSLTVPAWSDHPSLPGRPAE